MALTCANDRMHRLGETKVLRLECQPGTCSKLGWPATIRPIQAQGVTDADSEIRPG